MIAVCAGSFYVSDKVRAALAGYTRHGGKLLWIGGVDKGLLGRLSQSLKPADRALLPVGMDYEDAKREGAAAVARVSVRFLGELKNAAGKGPSKFVNNPNTSGWTTPRCNVQIVSDDPRIRMLAAVSDGAKTMNIAAALVDQGGARHVFLPQYLLLPFVLSRDQTMDFSHPTFDSVGRGIILAATEMLAPQLTPGRK